MENATNLNWLEDEDGRLQARWRGLSLLVERLSRFEPVRTASTNVLRIRPSRYRAFAEGVIVRPRSPIFTDVNEAKSECCELAKEIWRRIEAKRADTEDR